jgi:hypothetical protein
MTWVYAGIGAAGIAVALVVVLVIVGLLGRREAPPYWEE